MNSITDRFYSIYHNTNVKKLLVTVGLDSLAKGTDFFLFPIYLLLMPQNQYGLYTYLIYIVTNAGNVLRLGLDTSISKLYYECADDRQRGEVLYTVSLFISGFIGLIFFVCFVTDIDSWLIQGLLSDKNTTSYPGFRLAFLGCIALNIAQVILNVYYAISDKIRVFQLYTLAKVLGVSLVVITVLRLYGGNAATRLVWEFVIGTIIISPLLFNYISHLTYRFDPAIAKQALKIGLPMMGAVVVGIMYSLTDKYFLQKYSGLDYLATYNLGIFLTTPITMIFMSFHVIWLPMFYKEKNWTESFTRTMRVSRGLLFGFVTLSLLIWLAIIVLLKVNIIKSGYQALVWIYPLVAFSRIIESLAQLLNNYVVVLGKTLFNFYSSILLGVMAVVFNLILISKYGLPGAACSTVLLAILRITLLFIFTTRNLKLDLRNALWG